MIMKTLRTLRAMMALAGMAFLSGSCATWHVHPHHYRHPHHHRIVIVAEDTATRQCNDCLTLHTGLAMTGPDTYGSTE